jgi:hypothetical protein
VLANLLPGIREVRTPLAAGYLWLAFLWLATGGLPDVADSPLVRSVQRLLAGAGPLASVAALALVAYLTGVVSVAGTNYILDLVAKLRNRKLRGWIGGYRSDHFGLLGRVAAAKAAVKEGEGVVIRRLTDHVILDLGREDGTGFVRTILRSEAEAAASTLDDAIGEFERWLKDQRNPIDMDAVGGSVAYQQFVTAYRRHVAQLSTADDQEPVMQDAHQIVRFSVAAELSRRLRDDMPFLLTRLIGVESDLYAAIDRQSAEGEFRAGVSLPLAALVSVVGATYEPILLSALFLPTALFWLGIRRHREAQTTLAQALYAGRVWSPVLGGPAPQDHKPQAAEADTATQYRRHDDTQPPQTEVDTD